jgi:succinate-semialdehyde dehydrogenase/glutarate-semialdehyde dehydrogenase
MPDKEAVLLTSLTSPRLPSQLPIAMASRKIAAAIAAGCTSVVKPAGETPFATLTMCLLAERVGIPAGVINCITGLDNTAILGEALCTDPRVKKISFTGSTRVGKLLVKQSADIVGIGWKRSLYRL